MSNISSVCVVMRVNKTDPDIEFRRQYPFHVVKLFRNQASLIEEYSNDISAIRNKEQMINNDQQISLYNERRQKFLLLVEYLAAIPPTEQSHQELINECRKRYENNTQEQSKIDEFVNDYYAKNNSIKWYTRDSFIYRLLNQACRSESIKLIYTFRSFISYLYKQLQSLPPPTSTISVYRGQLLSQQELDILKSHVGERFFTNTFLSTSVDIDIAVVFSGSGEDKTGLQSVIFEYKLDIDKKSKPFANISHHSNFSGEDEVLICMGTLFKLDSIEFNEDLHVWYIKLILHEYDSKISNYYPLFRQDPRTTPILLLLAEYLQTEKLFTDAEYFNRLYFEDETNRMENSNLEQVYINLACICQEKGEYATAIDNLDTAWKYCAVDNYKSRLEILSIKAEIMKILCNWNEAIIIYKQINETFNMSDNEHAKFMNEIGEIFIQLKEWSKGIDAFEQALRRLHTVNLISERRLQSRIKTNLTLAQLQMKTDHLRKKR